MRYRAAIYVDIWAEEGKIAGKKLDKIVKSIPNAFSDVFLRFRMALKSH